MKTKIVIISILSMVLSVNVFARKQSAQAFIESFYKFERTRSGDFNAREITSYKRFLSADLNGLLQNELKREKEYLKKNPTDKPFFGDGLPFEPSDECYKMGKFYKHDHKTGALTTDGAKTLVEIDFYLAKVCGGDFSEKFKLELVKTKGAWLINDFIYGDGKRLSDDLKRTEY